MTEAHVHAPNMIGRYKVERLVGQGGMGRVWLARDTVLGRRVAIKVLRDDLALPPSVRDELVVRMGHEAQAAAAVSHPNIVTLYDMGEDDTVGLFLVFEYVPNANEETPLSLRDRLKTGPLPLGEVAKLARELGTALSFAHETGVIHRDIKPENILFSRTGFKIADFGIARIPDSTITRANTVLGTPAYTSPEALSKGDFGEASDQFSLAATIYEAATGRRAFAGDDAIATAGKVSSEPPPPLEPEVGPPTIIEALNAALQRGLAKAPEGRFRSCAELGQEVARILESDPARRPGSLRPPRVEGQPTPVPGMLDIERTPLSSRAVHAERLLSEPGARAPVETVSIYQRKRTQRFQNIAAGLALIVIVVLVLLGRRAAPPVEDDAGAPVAHDRDHEHDRDPTASSGGPHRPHPNNAPSAPSAPSTASAKSHPSARTSASAAAAPVPISPEDAGTNGED